MRWLTPTALPQILPTRTRTLILGATIAGLLCSGTARADAFRLANGSVIEGTLATYELGGNCQIFVSAGTVRGATLLLPCEEILAFSRPGEAPPQRTQAQPAAATLAAVAEPVPTPVAVPAAVPVAAPAVDPAPSPQVVIASLPEGTVLPGDDLLAEDALAEDALADQGAAPAPPPATSTPPPTNLRGTPRAVPSMDAGEEDTSTPDADASRAEPTTIPAGWQQRGATKKKDMPRWLYRTIYGEEPPQPDAAETSGSDSDS